MNAKNRPSETALFLYLLALFLIWALLWPAIWSAVETGKVVVGQVGRYGSTTEMVPWRQGWARFAGPVLLLAALETWRRTKRLWTSLGSALAGVVLVTSSIQFTSLGRAALFFGFNIFIVASLLIGNRFGRAAVFAFVATVFVLLFWMNGTV